MADTQAVTIQPSIPPAQELHKPDDGPFSSGELPATLIMLAIAMAGGVANFYGRVKTGEARAFNLAELVGEMFISGSAGIIAYWVFRGLNVNTWFVAAGVGVCGHMGSRFIFLGEKIIESLLDKMKNKLEA